MLTKIQKKLLNIPYDINFEKIVENYLNNNHNEKIIFKYKLRSQDRVYFHPGKYYFDNCDSINPMESSYQIKRIHAINQMHILKDFKNNF